MSYYNYCSPIVGKDHLFEHFFRWVETTSYALKYQFIMFCPILLPTALFGLVLYVAQNVGQSKRLVCPFKEHLRQKGWNDWNPHPNHTMVTIPRCFMYGIFTYMHHRFKPNVGKYSIHGASGICLWKLLESLPGALRRLLLVHDMAAVGLEFEQFPITQHNPSIKLSLTRVNPETQKPEQRLLVIICNYIIYNIFWIPNS